jgi:hypothetical protein
VLMCGVFTGGMTHHGPGSREWNALLDPYRDRGRVSHAVQFAPLHRAGCDRAVYDALKRSVGIGSLRRGAPWRLC